MILRVLKEFDADEVYEISRSEVTIGRDNENQIIVLDDLVSRRHARISYDGESYWVEDLNSTNGTYLNSMPVDRSPLKSGDKINIGKATILVQETHEPISSGKPAVHIIDTEKTMDSDILTMSSQDAALFLQPVERIDLESLRRENETLKKLFKLNNFITSTRNIKVLIDKILELSFEMINADNVCILLTNEKTGDLEVKSMLSKDNSQTVTVSRTIVNHVLERGNSVLSSDAMDDTRFAPHKSIISANIKSVVCTPIQAGKIAGIFYADMRSSKNKFSEDDLKIVTILSNMVGIALENDFWHREAIKKERLSAIGEVITGLSHYAKNILNGLKLAIQALEVSVSISDAEKAQKSLKAIKAQEKRISNLVLNMLDYSKERIPVKQEVDIREVVQDIIDPYMDYFKEKNIEFIFEIDDKFPEVNVDITGIHRVFLNLFTNAIDAIKDQAKGLIKICVHHERDGNAFTASVEDNGIGIEKKYQEKIFDVFYSTKNFEGTGLGLAVVKKIVMEHGGTIFVVSSPGHGSKFIMHLPVK
ncbi:MAG: FHA domain-containing protein [Candidatus Aureabacteria bacterium]|nr:FHA domain-containing protein [Candidatus Auribacterota bacterium]